MRVAPDWKDYSVIATGDGEKLERWGKYVLLRPDPQVIWRAAKPLRSYEGIDAVYERSSSGGGHWIYRSEIPEEFTIGWRGLRFKLKLMGFKHTGLFPEQAVNWDVLQKTIEEANRPVKVLNLFAYTGGATLACAAAGASVCHVDASKGMVAWAKENAKASGLLDRPIRWIVDDCKKFVQREIRRGNRYDIIIMDPPSYGRGPGGEVWQLEEEIYGLVDLCSQVLSDHPLLFVLNSYTTGLSPSVMAYLLGMTVGKRFAGEVSADEIGLPVEESGYVLPCGSTAFWKAK